VASGKTIRAIVLERGLLDEARLDAILSVDAMTRGGIVGAGQAGRAGQTGGAGRAAREGKAGKE
jgi:hypothetical protein